jgi:hypothetical protein
VILGGATMIADVHLTKLPQRHVYGVKNVAEPKMEATIAFDCVAAVIEENSWV